VAVVDRLKSLPYLPRRLTMNLRLFSLVASAVAVTSAGVDLKVTPACAVATSCAGFGVVFVGA
jgi:hypothetical protein